MIPFLPTPLFPPPLTSPPSSTNSSLSNVPLLSLFIPIPVPAIPAIPPLPVLSAASTGIIFGVICNPATGRRTSGDEKASSKFAASSGRISFPLSPIGPGAWPASRLSAPPNNEIFCIGAKNGLGSGRADEVEEEEDV